MIQIGRGDEMIETKWADHVRVEDAEPGFNLRRVSTNEYLGWSPTREQAEAIAARWAREGKFS